MTKRTPQYIDDYLDGIEPANRERGHRGILRAVQYAGSEVELPEYVKYLKSNEPDYRTPPPRGMIEPDGFFYTYADEYVSQAASLQEASAILKRNRSTLSGYCKHDSFPATKDSSGNWSFDVIGCQDWILLNTPKHDGLEPYWPDLAINCLITIDVDEVFKDSPQYGMHGPGVGERLAEFRAA